MTPYEATQTILATYLRHWPVPVDQLASLTGSVVNALHATAPIAETILKDAPKTKRYPRPAIPKLAKPLIDDVPPVESTPLPPKPVTVGQPVKLEPLTRLETMAPKEVVKAIEAGKGASKRMLPVTPATSVTPDYLVCLHCERRFQFLVRHLQSAHDQTFEAYRTQFKLAADYPNRAANCKVGRRRVWLG